MAPQYPSENTHAKSDSQSLAQSKDSPATSSTPLGLPAGRLLHPPPPPRPITSAPPPSSSPDESPRPHPPSTRFVDTPPSRASPASARRTLRAHKNRPA